MSTTLQDRTHTLPQDENPKARYVLYGAVAAVMAFLLVVMVVAYRGHEATVEAKAKAEVLAGKIEAAGFTAPDTDAIARVLGTDGGAVCENPGALRYGLLKYTFSNGAAGPGIRPVRIDRIVIGGERLIIETYCPDQLAEFDDFVDSLDFDDVAR